MHDFNNDSDRLSSLYGRIWVLISAYLVFLITLIVYAASTSLVEFLVVGVLMSFGAIALPGFILSLFTRSLWSGHHVARIQQRVQRGQRQPR